MNSEEVKIVTAKKTTVAAQTGLATADNSYSNNMTNITKVTIDTENSHRIVVQGNLNKMKTFSFDEDYKVVTTQDENGKTVSATEGKEYYALVIDTGYARIRETVPVGENIFTDAETVAKFGVKDSTSIVVLLEAGKSGNTYKIRSQADTAGNKVQEEFEFVVDFEDVSKAFVETAEDVRALSKVVKVIPEFENTNTSKYTMTVNVRKSAIIPSTMFETEGLWYALVVDTGVNSKELKVTTTLNKKVVEIPQDVEGLSNTEVVIWVNASLATQTFAIVNKNLASATFSLVVNTVEDSDLRISNLTKPTLVENDCKAYIGTEAYTTLNDNMTALTTVTKETGSTDEDATYKLSVVLNNLKSFNLLDKGEGKWVALTLDVGGDATKLNAGNLLADQEYSKKFGATGRNQVLVWVNLADIPVKADGVEAKAYELTCAVADDPTLVEKVTLRLIVDDTSIFKTESKVSQGYELTQDFAKKHPVKTHFANYDEQEQLNYYVNQALVKKVESNRDGNTVTVNVTGDFVKMNALTNNVGATGKLITLKLDLGVDCTTGFKMRYSKNDDYEGDDALLEDWENVTTSTDISHFGITKTQVIWNETLPTRADKVTGTIFTRTLEYKKDGEANADTIKFVINFIQEDVSSTEYEHIIEDCEKLPITK